MTEDMQKSHKALGKVLTILQEKGGCGKSSAIFNVSYYDSKTNFGIQLADLIVNTFYNYYANYKRVSTVIKGLNKSKYRVSLFPGRKVFGRIKKIDD